MLSSDWLEELFGPYDFYYLDPLIAKREATKQDSTASTSQHSWYPTLGNDLSKWHNKDVSGIHELLHKMTKIIGIEESDLDQGEIFDGMVRNGLLTDRAKQKQIVGLVEGALKKEKQISDLRKFPSVKHLCDATKRLRALPAYSPSQCLVVAKGTINRVDENIAPDLYAPVRVAPLVEHHQARRVHFVLSDLPWPLIWLETPSIGLMVCDKALAITCSIGNQTEIAHDLVWQDGWYPNAQVMGYWQTDRGGRPYIDVLAIMLKSYPTVDEMFHEVITPSIRKLEEMLVIGRDATEKSILDFPGAGYDLSNDRFLLFPLLLFCLCFHLNLVDTGQLKNRAPMIYARFSEYRNRLDELADLLLDREVQSLIPALLRTPRRALIKLLN